MLAPIKFFHILEWKIPNQTDWQDMVALISVKSDKIYARIIEEFGPNGLLIVGLFALFLGLIVVIYAKAVIDTFRPVKEDSPTELDEYISEINQEEAAAQLEAEKELSLHLITASEDSDDFLGVGADYERLKKAMQNYVKAQQEEFKNWQTVAKKEIISEKNLHTREIVSTIIKMLARQVSEAKIAQALVHRQTTPISMENILQTVRSVRDFIGLANAQMFAELPDSKTLPRPIEALRLLCEKGDNSLCLELLQKLTSQYIKDAMPEKGISRQLLLAQAANYACLTGNFATFDDIGLALTSYNFATEVSPESVNAWSRLGDAYVKQGNETKAMFAYQSVLELADPYMYEQQLANAKNHLSPYYERQGIAEKAAQFAHEAARYYDNCGLNEPLTILEDAAVDHIISRQEINESLEILFSTLQ